MKVIIPARRGSKGLPFKNRQLFQYTADIIPKEFYENVWVTTDDEQIIESASHYPFNTIHRPIRLAEDETSIRDVMFHAIEKIRASLDEPIVMLYLTYPERTWSHVEEALSLFIKHYSSGLCDSLLCRKEIKSHPYLYMYERGVDGLFGDQMVKHDEYRRQAYPPCFEISHYISIFTQSSINKLNRNLYSEDTLFFRIPDVIDVDTKIDLTRFNARK
jgi:CMP-N-acetylneuraminic acid synthetase